MALTSRTTSRRTAAAFITMAIAAAAVGLTACKDREPQPAVTGDAGTAVIEYTTRAILTRLPTATEPDELLARHEAIPEYRQTSGRYGMNVMTMPFPLPSSGVSLEGLTVGDPVEIRFAVTYSADYSSLKGYVVRSIERLPADTELDFTPLAEIEGFDPETGMVGGTPGQADEGRPTPER